MKISKKDIIYWVLISILIVLLCFSVNKCSNSKLEYKNNIEALNDSIRYVQDKNGNLVATKLAFEAELKDLKLLNKELYEEIETLRKSGNSVNSGVQFSGTVQNPESDTIYIVSHDTIDRGFEKSFAFNNEYRKLEGKVSYSNDTVGVNINKDEVYFDYTIAIDNKNNILIKSSNPYIMYSEISGFQIPKEKKKRWYLGPSVNVGYDPVSGRISPTVGVSIGYGILRW